MPKKVRDENGEINRDEYLKYIKDRWGPKAQIVIKQLEDLGLYDE